MEAFKKITGFLLLLLGLSLHGQECPEPVYPRDGDTGVPVDALIQWTPVEEDELITAYLISVGTTADGEEIESQRSVSRNTQYQLPCGIPPNTQLFIDIYLFSLTQGTILCTSYSFTTGPITEDPGCIALTRPMNGDINVNIGTSLIWSCEPGATGYTLSVGRTSGDYDIISNLELPADQLSYTFDNDLPENQDIFVRIVPTNGNADCAEQFFTTGEIAVLPECPVMQSPEPGANNIGLNPILTWTDVFNLNGDVSDRTQGYKVFMGTSPDQNDVLNGDTFYSNSTPFLTPLIPNTIYYIRIIPFNEAGENFNCTRQFTFSTILGCFFENENGEVIDNRPQINLEDAYGICQNNSSLRLAEDPDFIYEWFRISPFGDEELLSTENEIEISEPGEYRVKKIKIITDAGSQEDVKCETDHIFTVSESQKAVIDRTDVQLGAGVISIEIFASGLGDYEYALDEAGPYQESNRFTNLPIDNYRVFVRDKNGCGIADELVEPDLTLDGFPKFFTPNGDGINDTWQFIPPASGLNPIRELHIFDRYGKLLVQIDPRSQQGWNGTFNGRPLPASDYWFRAVNDNNQVLQGHFSLKR